MHRKGFSLVELMVVVAIIGILATMALPRYQNFRARARQGESKGLLTTIYTSEQSFFAEYATYHFKVYLTGFSRDGFTWDGLDFVADATTRAYYNFYVHGGVAGSVPTPAQLNLSDPYPTYQEDGSGYFASTTLCTAMSHDSEQAWFGSAGAAVTPTSFEARTIGCPLNPNPGFGAFPMDRWSIDQNRVIKNISMQ